MKHSIETQIEIKATADLIWKVLMEMDQYQFWNPFITSLEGEMKQNGQLKAVIGGMKFSPKILIFEPNQHLSWKGKFLISGVFDGEHHFEIIQIGEGRCLLKQYEHFNGVLVGMMKKKLDTDTKGGFVSMNEALKARCEAVALQKR